MDLTSLAWFLVIGLGIVGALRGVRSEAITLTGVIAGGAIFSNEELRQRVVIFINRLPSTIQHLVAPEDEPVPLEDGLTGVISTADERLFFYLGTFGAAVVLFYLAGNKFGSAPFGGADRLLGAIMGGLGGFAIGVTLLNFSQDYLELRGGEDGFTIELPSIISPTLPAENLLSAYTPMVFVGAMVLIAFVVAFSVVRR